MILRNLRFAVHPFVATVECLLSRWEIPERAELRVVPSDADERDRAEADRIDSRLPQRLRNQGAIGLNPKIREFVVELNLAGIRTLLSGDLYSGDLIYVDIRRPSGPVTRALARALERQGWFISLRPDADHAFAAAQQQRSFARKKSGRFWERAFEPFDLRIRLVRPGLDMVSSSQGRMLTAALVKSLGGVGSPARVAGLSSS